MLTFLRSSLRSDKKSEKVLVKSLLDIFPRTHGKACLVSQRQTACLLFNFGNESKWRPGILEVNLLNLVGGHLCPLTICCKHVDRSMGMELCLSPLCFNHSTQRCRSLSPDNKNTQSPALLNNTTAEEAGWGGGDHVALHIHSVLLVPHFDLLHSARKFAFLFLL